MSWLRGYPAAEFAEPERVWTDTAHRRRGYRRVYPTTDDRQPEAPPTESEVYPMAFVKELS